MGAQEITTLATVGGFSIALAGFIWALFSRLESRIDRVEVELRNRLEGEVSSIRGDLGGLRGDLGELRGEIGELRGRLDEQSSLLRQVLASILPQRAA